MQLGVVFPQTEIGAEPADVRRYALAAEDLGYDYLLAYDHVVGVDPDRPGPWKNAPYTYKTMFHEPLVLFGYLAGITERLAFATSILILPQRQTVLVAKQAAQVDVLSGGRLRLGVGVGWNSVEYESLGQDFHTRGERQAEQVRLLRKLWTQRLVDFEGRFDRVPEAGIYPLPVQRPIPIWFGGGAEPVLRRMAKLGDGWMPNAGYLADLAHHLDKLRTWIADAGRDPASFGVDVRIDMGRIGPAAWADTLGNLHALGVTHVSINTMGLGFDLDQHLDAIQQFREVASESDLDRVPG
jgi:probable F420-dependent oxidoreductase